MYNEPGIFDVILGFIFSWKMIASTVGLIVVTTVLVITPGKRAKVITSIAMFYDLEDPMRFMREIHHLLDDDGIWVFEQSYMPAMLESVAYDTVCHEHLGYYGLRQIQWMAERVGFELLDVEFNRVNGGSFSVTAARAGSRSSPVAAPIVEALKREERDGLGREEPYRRFRQAVVRHREGFRDLMLGTRARRELVVGWGASTKGNVVLQYCGLTSEDIRCIGEVNESKFGHYTPGTGIPIVSEQQAKDMSPDYLLVFPWHYRDFFVTREASYVDSGGRLIFPLPIPEVYPS